MQECCKDEGLRLKGLWLLFVKIPMLQPACSLLHGATALVSTEKEHWQWKLLVCCFFLGGLRVGGECRWFVKLVVSVWLLMMWCIWLQDDDPYVRKTAAVCVAKLHDINAELVEERGFVEALKDMISDSNPMVVANAVAALAEIQEGSSKNVFEITNHTLFKLLAALNECTEYDPSCFCQFYKLSCLGNCYWY